MLIKMDIKNYIQSNIPNFIGPKLVCIDNNFTLQTKFLLVVMTSKNLLNGFLNNKNIVTK